MSLTESDHSEHPHPDSTFHPGAVLTVAMGHTVHDTYVGFVPVLLPHFVERFALTNTKAGWLAACTQLPSILQPFFGHLADRLVLRWVVMLAPAVTATGMSLVGWAPGFIGLAALLAVVGLSSAAFHAVGSATAGHLSGAHLGKGLSVWMVGGELGMVIGPLLAGGALAALTLKGLSWLMVLGWTASYLLYRRLRSEALHAVADTERPEWRDALRRMRPIMLLMAGLVVLRAMSVSAPAVFSPIFLKEEGSSGLVAAAAVTLFQESGMFGTLGAGWVSDRVGRRAVLLFGAIAGPAGLLLFTALEGWARFPFLFLAGAATLSMHPVCMALVQERFPESRGLANALYLSTVFVISSAGAVGVGILGDHIGLRPAFVVSALITVLSVPLMLMLPPDRRRG
ncbi:MAG: MFS transporter [Acidimicrobiia bacterium]|nr:MFS transporter [Acidimicrobiia bacterium]